METQCGRKPDNVFSYMSLRSTLIGSTDFLFSPTATGRRLLSPIFPGYNLREDPTPQFFGYNHKEDTTPYFLWIQPQGGYNPLFSLAATTYPCPIQTALKYK
jgi:hypothetical protein